MSSANPTHRTKSPDLRAVIVEPILISCIDGASLRELGYVIQRLYPPTFYSYSFDILKKYLFYMIEYDLISYNGQIQVYVIENEGLFLLSKINRRKRFTMDNNKNIVIRIEGVYR